MRTDNSDVANNTASDTVDTTPVSGAGDDGQGAGEETGHGVDELPTPPWTAAPEHSETHPTAPTYADELTTPGDGSAVAPVPPSAEELARSADADAVVDGSAPAAKSFLHRPIPGRTWAIGAVAVALAAGLFGAGTLVGARDPMLAPVRIAAAPESAGLTPAERVYATVKDSVVTIQVPGGGTGSGFFYRPDRIVTNDHVVASSSQVLADLSTGKKPKVTIALADGRIRQAKVIGVDPHLDLAILQAPTGLGVRPLAFADSATVQPGAPAIVVGSPFGLTTSVSSGIISGVDRGGQFAEDPVQNQLIQTDAAVNPGNSGGPLLDETAGVVGIVTLRPDEADGRTTQGLAFALPSTLVVNAINQLEKYGKVSHPQLGVLLRDPDLSKGQRGAIVTGVVDESAAAEAGLVDGDQLLTVDGQETQSAAAVIDTLVGKRAGDEVTLDVLRGGVRHEVTVTLRERTS